MLSTPWIAGASLLQNQNFQLTAKTHLQAAVVGQFPENKYWAVSRPTTGIADNTTQTFWVEWTPYSCSHIARSLFYVQTWLLWWLNTPSHVNNTPSVHRVMRKMSSPSGCHAVATHKTASTEDNRQSTDVHSMSDCTYANHHHTELHKPSAGTVAILVSLQFSLHTHSNGIYIGRCSVCGCHALTSAAGVALQPHKWCCSGHQNTAFGRCRPWQHSAHFHAPGSAQLLHAPRIKCMSQYCHVCIPQSLDHNSALYVLSTPNNVP